MKQSTVIIFGAGISGLVAARKLLRAGHQVEIWEARHRTGGRICSLPGGEQVIEAGPEFIHGRLEATIALLQEYRLDYHQTKGRSYQSVAGSLRSSEGDDPGWEEMMQKMSGLEEDLSLGTFLHRFFAADGWAALRRRAIAFAGGFDLADPDLVSVASLYREWTMEDAPQYRIPAGYGALTAALESEIRERGGILRLGEPLERTAWTPGKVTAFSSSGLSTTAGKAIFTLPVSLVSESARATQWLPGLPEKIEAAAGIGFGSVIKFVLDFHEPFWAKQAPGALFFFSEEIIPTWWTDLPSQNARLTGWLGGLPAMAYTGKPESELLALAWKSLSGIFSVSPDKLTAMLRQARVFDWRQDPHSRGAYSFTLAGASGARAAWAAPVANTLYFAGEACHEGPMVGTVEAAVLSGHTAAQEIITAPDP